MEFSHNQNMDSEMCDRCVVFCFSFSFFTLVFGTIWPDLLSAKIIFAYFSPFSITYIPVILVLEILFPNITFFISPTLTIF